MPTTSISLELPAWAAVAVGTAITALLGIIAWFLRRQMIRKRQD